MSEFTDHDRMREVVSIRADYVDKYVARRIDMREGDCSNEEIIAWENSAYEVWRNQHPALNSLLPSHLPEDVTA